MLESGELPRYFDGMSTSWLNGAVVRSEYSTGPGMAPRMPGYECGCSRSGSRDRGWLIVLCSEHRGMGMSEIDEC